MIGAVREVVRRDLMLAVRQRSDVTNTLRTIGPSIVWVAAVLASTLSLNRRFANDLADGTLKQTMLTREPLAGIVLGKVGAHWLLTGLRITVMAVLLGVMFDLLRDATATLALGLGAPALWLIGAVGAALALDLLGGDVLLSLSALSLRPSRTATGRG